MLQDVFFALAHALPWDALLQRYTEDLFTRNGYAWPRPGTALTMPELAQEFGIAATLLARTRDQWLSRDLWDDANLAQDFRSAMLRLCLARLEPEGDTLESPVLQWLRGEKVGLTQLRQYDIAARITRTNARAMLISLCHFVRKAGAGGPAADAGPAPGAARPAEGRGRRALLARRGDGFVRGAARDHRRHRAPPRLVLARAWPTRRWWRATAAARWTLTRRWRCGSGPTSGPATGRTHWRRW